MKPTEPALVRFNGASKEQIQWGGNDDPNIVLNKGDKYEVEDIEVHSWHTKIRLAGIKGRFNDASFTYITLKDKVWDEACEEWKQRKGKAT